MTFSITPCTQDQVLELEGRVGLNLPEEYVAFLTGPEHNPRFKIAIGMENETRRLGFVARLSPSSPPKFLSIHKFLSGTDSEIEIAYVAFLDWGHPKNFLPIVSLDINDAVFMCLSGPERGGIFMAGDKWFELYNQNAEITIGDYVKISSDFMQFLSILEWEKETDL